MLFKSQHQKLGKARQIFPMILLALLIGLSEDFQITISPDENVFFYLNIFFNIVLVLLAYLSNTIEKKYFKIPT